MSTVVTYKLENNVIAYSSLRFQETVSIYAIRLHLIKHGTLSDGDIKLELFDGARSLGSQSINYQEFEDLGATYAHGSFKFQFDESIRVNLEDTDSYREVQLEISVENHTDSEDNYLGIVIDFDNPFVGEHGDRAILSTPEVDNFYNPYRIEVYTV